MVKIEMKGEFVTTREFALKYNLKVSEVRDMCRSGYIKAFKIRGIWHIPREELNKFSKLDLEIIKTKLALKHMRMYRVASGKATSKEYFWFGIGFGRGRFALGRIITLLLYLAFLKFAKKIKELINKKEK